MDMGEQQTIVVVPPADPPASYTWIIPGVVVPIVIAVVGWLAHRRKK